MQKFFLKLCLIFFIGVMPNFFIGLYRYIKKDNSLQLNQNLNAENFIFNYKIKNKSDTVMSIYRKGDLSSKLSRLDDTCCRVYDKFGFSNWTFNNKPKIVLIGDSQFHDPGKGTEYGFQNSLNTHFGFNCSYNIGAVLCSGFRVYNEFLKEKIFLQKPKYIVLEIGERNFLKWDNIFNELKMKSTKTIKYRYFGLDLMLSNNFKGFSLINDKKEHILLKYDTFLFYKNKVSILDNISIEHVVKQIESVKDYLANQNIKLLILIAPDKESFFPSIFGKSSYQQIHKALDQKQIPNLNVIDLFKKDSSLYYYNDDTHWNQHAIDLITLEIYKWISQNN
jgi:hypothetical protein